MKLPKFTLFRRVAFRRKKRNAYSLLLRKKKQVRKRPQHSTLPKKPVMFFWEKYKNAFAGVVGGIGVFVVLAGVFFFSNFFSIREIYLTRNDPRVKPDGIFTVLNTFRQQNIFLVSQQDVQKALMQKFSEIESVEVQKKLPGAIEVSVSTYPIIAKWQLQIPVYDDPLLADIEVESEPEIETLTYFVNEIGRVADWQEDDEGITFSLVEYVGDDIPTIYLGYEILERARFEEILQAKSQLEQIISEPIVGVELIRNAQEVHFVSERGVEFWVDYADTFANQIAKIELALTEHNIFDEELKYVDLRIPGKIYPRPVQGE